MKIRDLIRLIESDGWRYVHTDSSHRQYKHLLKKGRLTVAGLNGDDPHPNTLKSVLAGAGLKRMP